MGFSLQCKLYVVGLCSFWLCQVSNTLLFKLHWKNNTEGVTCSWVDLQEGTVSGSLADPRSHGLNSLCAGLSAAPLTPQAAGCAAHFSLVNINY